MIKKWGILILTAGAILMAVPGCRKPVAVTSSSEVLPLEKNLNMVGYTIQVGAFSEVDNALRLMNSLREEGIDAYYFRHMTGLFKVRFGEFSLRKEAEIEAQNLKSQKIIEDFYIVNPQISATKKITRSNKDTLRTGLVETARQYQGLPYCWGGDSIEEGFDCSGLAAAVYRLNGLSLPRTSRAQYDKGMPVSTAQLLPGDLVFFEMYPGKGISHVGIYLEGGRFIHAPSRNKTIRINSLNNPYYRERFRGARRYIY